MNVALNLIAQALTESPTARPGSASAPASGTAEGAAPAKPRSRSPGDAAPPAAADVEEGTSFEDVLSDRMNGAEGPVPPTRPANAVEAEPTHKADEATPEGAEDVAADDAAPVDGPVSNDKTILAAAAPELAEPILVALTEEEAALAANAAEPTDDVARTVIHPMSPTVHSERATASEFVDPSPGTGAPQPTPASGTVPPHGLGQVTEPGSATTATWAMEPATDGPTPSGTDTPELPEADSSDTQLGAPLNSTARTQQVPEQAATTGEPTAPTPPAGRPAEAVEVPPPLNQSPDPRPASPEAQGPTPQSGETLPSPVGGRDPQAYTESDARRGTSPFGGRASRGDPREPGANGQTRPAAGVDAIPPIEPATASASRSAAAAAEDDAAGTAAVGRLVRTVSLTVRAGGGTARVLLEPPSLGRVDVEVTVRDGALSATFQTHTRQAAELVTNHLPQLRAALERQGLTVARLDVSSDDSSSGGPAMGTFGGRHGADQPPHSNAPWSWTPEDADVSAEPSDDGTLDWPIDRGATALVGSGLSLNLLA